MAKKTARRKGKKTEGGAEVPADRRAGGGELRVAAGDRDDGAAQPAAGAVGPSVGRRRFGDDASAQPAGARQPCAAPARAGGRAKHRHHDDAARAEALARRCFSRRSAASSASPIRRASCNVTRAAVAHGTTAFISTAAKPGLEEAAAAVKEPLIFQLYVRADRKWVEDILDRAKAAGYRALCVCVDRNYYGRRERDIVSRANVREGFGDPVVPDGTQVERSRLDEAAHGAAADRQGRRHGGGRAALGRARRRRRLRLQPRRAAARPRAGHHRGPAGGGQRRQRPRRDPVGRRRAARHRRRSRRCAWARARSASARCWAGRSPRAARRDSSACWS